jgi:hypothetical protein
MAWKKASKDASPSIKGSCAGKEKENRTDESSLAEKQGLSGLSEKITPGFPATSHSGFSNQIKEPNGMRSARGWWSTNAVHVTGDRIEGAAGWVNEAATYLFNFLFCQFARPDAA